jgi:hypothetical protein
MTGSRGATACVCAGGEGEQKLALSEEYAARMPRNAEAWPKPKHSCGCDTMVSGLSTKTPAAVGKCVNVRSIGFNVVCEFESSELESPSTSPVLTQHLLHFRTEIKLMLSEGTLSRAGPRLRLFNL